MPALAAAWESDEPKVLMERFLSRPRSPKADDKA